MNLTTTNSTVSVICVTSLIRVQRKKTGNGSMVQRLASPHCWYIKTRVDATANATQLLRVQLSLQWHAPKADTMYIHTCIRVVLMVVMVVKDSHIG